MAESDTAWHRMHASPATHPAVLIDDMTLDTTGVADTPRLLCLSSAAGRGRQSPWIHHCLSRKSSEPHSACKHLLLASFPGRSHLQSFIACKTTGKWEWTGNEAVYCNYCLMSLLATKSNLLHNVDSDN